jgi:hypothetical protein
MTSETTEALRGAMYLPLPPGVARPVRWGTAEGLRGLFGVAASRDQAERGGGDADR